MAKKRKTREQKKLADLRHTFQHQIVNTFEAKLPFTKIEQKAQAATISISAYPYLAKDLTRTFLLTSAIVACQLMLFFLLKNHLITIPGLSY